MSTSRTERAVDLLVCVGVEDVMRPSMSRKMTGRTNVLRV
jgi:hypothetical protein